jgi:hypothetical protein
VRRFDRLRVRPARWLIAAALGILPILPADAQSLVSFVPVGARYVPAGDAPARARDLDDMRRLHFTVVSLASVDGRPDRLAFLDRVIANAPYPDLTLDAPERIAIVPASGAPQDLKVRAWSALARGARGIVFDDWTVLARNADALAEAAAFAEAVTRNAALYAPLRPRRGEAGQPDPGLTKGTGEVEARLLESSAAIVFIAVNHADSARDLMVTFPAGIPEAIWRNMFSGASVSFVTGRNGAAYQRTLAAKEVLVLAINKRLQ